MSDETLIEGTKLWAMEMPPWLAHETRIMSWVVSAEQSLAWHYSKLLTGFTLKRRDDGWMLVVHVLADASTGAGRPMVAFIRGDTVWGTFEAFALALKRDELRWKTDKWPPFAQNGG